MKKHLPSLEARPVAVLGLGRSGLAAARLLRARGYEPVVLDSGDSAGLRKAAAGLAEQGVRCVLGDDALRGFEGYSWGVLSPGIDPATPLVAGIRGAGVALISEIELAWRCCEKTVVAITGTNGKTTTTGLLAEMLGACGCPAAACGNIGEPFSAALLDSPDVGCYVVEVSSFQLEACDSFRPKVAVWTNFSPNHLDRYRDVGEYYEAKVRVYDSQTSDDFAVVRLGTEVPNLAVRVLTFSATEAGGDFSLKGKDIFLHGRRVLEQGKTRMPGVHNAENLMAALGVIYALGHDMEKAVLAAESYETPEHRCEFVAEIGGVQYLNDSKSTNLDATEKAIRSQERPIVLIAGGKDKGFGFGPLKELVRERVSHAVLIGQLKEKIALDWEGVACTKCGDLPEAVRQAAALALPGSVVLFSPGTSSFDMFRDYEERGRVFKEAVLSISKTN